jgi:hypothetical protein
LADQRLQIELELLTGRPVEERSGGSIGARHATGGRVDKQEAVPRVFEQPARGQVLRLQLCVRVRVNSTPRQARISGESVRGQGTPNQRASPSVAGLPADV